MGRYEEGVGKRNDKRENEEKVKSETGKQLSSTTRLAGQAGAIKQHKLD
jgi:hypothetical protein